MKTGFGAAIMLTAMLSAGSAYASEIPKFGKTCVGNHRSTTSICLSSNGRTISTSYMYRGEIPTKGTHTGCTVKASSIVCAGGKYRTSRGSGPMNAIVIKLSKGKPVSLAWR